MGLANAAHGAGSAVQSALKPQYPTGECAPASSVSSYPGGNAGRRRWMLEATTSVSRPPDGFGVLGAVGRDGAVEHAATHSAATTVNHGERTPVDTTGNA